jgi:hypothetical protein
MVDAMGPLARKAWQESTSPLLTRLNAGASPKTMNSELGYVRAVFNELRDLGQIDFENPHAELVTLPCLPTGARWSEAETLHHLLVCT